MSEERTNYKTSRGGRRPGAGRKFLDGSDPGEGEPLAKVTVSLPQWMVDYLKELGGGVTSRGVRKLVNKAKKK